MKRLKDQRKSVDARDEVPLKYVFVARDGRHLNHITCTKNFPSLGIYGHRFTVYTTLVD